MNEPMDGATPENAAASDDTTVAVGRPRTTLDLAAAKLRTALQERSGYVVVTAESGAAAETLFATVEPRLTTFRTVRASGHDLDPEAIVRSLWRDGEPPFPARLAMRSLIDEARAAGRPIVVAITDADVADPARLERVRLTLEGAPDASEIVRIALLGGPALIEVLRQPDTRAVAMRIGASIQVPATTTDITSRRDASEASPAPRRGLAIVGVLLAVGGLAAWATWPRPTPSAPPLPPPHEAPALVPAPVAVPVPPVGVEEPVHATPEAAALAKEPEEPPAPEVVPEPPRPESAPPAAVVAPPPQAETPTPRRGEATLQVGAFVKAEAAEALRAKLAPQFPTVFVVTTVRGGTTFHRVRVGGFRSAHDLGVAEAMLRSTGLRPVRVRD